MARLLASQNIRSSTPWLGASKRLTGYPEVGVLRATATQRLALPSAHVFTHLAWGQSCRGLNHLDEGSATLLCEQPLGSVSQENGTGFHVNSTANLSSFWFAD